MNHRWLQGPEFLLKPENEWPIDSTILMKLENDPEVKANVITLCYKISNSRSYGLFIKQVFRLAQNEKISCLDIEIYHMGEVKEVSPTSQQIVHRRACEC